MVQVKRNINAVLTLPCDDPADFFEAHYTNQGEPFREGILLGIKNNDFNKEVQVMLVGNEAIKLRDFLLEQFPL